MNVKQFISTKILNEVTLPQALHRWRLLGKSIVFTNGCFDLLHPGHIHTLQEAAALGDILLVGLNSDSSVKRLKGPERPLNGELARAQVLAALLMVDAIMIFEEDTPLELIRKVMPDVLVKGGDYQPHEVVGADEVIAKGGRVEIIPFLDGFSTTGLVEKIRRL